MRILDSLTQLSVISITQVTPPASPAPGDRYIVPTGATGAWVGQDTHLAVWDENTWRFFPATEGWVAWDQAGQVQVAFVAGQWAPTAPPLQNLDMVGINTTADATNRLAVFSDASLFSHDTNGSHQLKINKDMATDTASLLFQTGWSGYAEMGTMGANDFSIKTSPDGAQFNTSILADTQTGMVSFPSGVEGLIDTEFGAEELVTVDYIASRGTDMVTNGTGLLGNNYNFPTSFAFDPIVTPNIPGSFRFQGYGGALYQSEEFLPVDPNQVYRLRTYVRQGSVAGNWSTFTRQERQRQYMGLLCFDVDKKLINSHHHMRYRDGGVDSLTTLSAPLTPGDTVLQLTDASGWNDSVASGIRRGLTIFGYKNSFGTPYSHYSRIFGFGMFDLAGIDKTNNQITLTAPFPSSMGNPDHPNGTWPVGTRLANSASGDTYKYSGFANLVPTQSDTWYKTTNFVGGIDQSGQNRFESFSPGTAYVKVLWLPNVSNHAGGSSSFPDTGADHKILYSGVSLSRENTATAEANPDGSKTLRTMQADAQTGVVSMQAAGLNVEEL
ncbi:MAG: DUF2793 domain-containing protein [Planktomarina sp.]